MGYIYILTNPSFPEYVKIGYADDVKTRLTQLNRSECTPFAFRVYATYEVSTRLTDMKIHDVIDKLNPNLRSIDNVNGKKRVREFYAMSKEDAYSLLEAVPSNTGSGLSPGNIWIIIGVVCLAVGFLAAMFIFKKKKPALASGENTDEE